MRTILVSLLGIGAALGGAQPSFAAHGTMAASTPRTGITTTGTVQANATFPVHQEVLPGVSVNSGTTVSITYSWPTPGAKVTTQWGNRGIEIHHTLSNTLTVRRVLTTCLASEKINVFTKVERGNGDPGSASIAIFVGNRHPCN